LEQSFVLPNRNVQETLVGHSDRLDGEESAQRNTPTHMHRSIGSLSSPYSSQMQFFRILRSQGISTEALRVFLKVHSRRGWSAGYFRLTKSAFLSFRTLNRDHKMGGVGCSREVRRLSLVCPAGLENHPIGRLQLCICGIGVFKVLKDRLSPGPAGCYCKEVGPISHLST